MEENTKKGLIIGGSVLAVVLLAGGITLGVVLGGANKATNTISANDYGIGAFSNLESFDNDGFNNGVKKAGELYLSEYDGNDDYFVNKDKKELEKKTSFYSGDGREYVDMLTDYYSTNDIIISAGFQVGGALKGMPADPTDETVVPFDGVFTDKEGNDTAYANSTDKAFVLLDDAELPTLYSNTASISFAAEGAGYMAAQIAYGYTLYDAFTNHTEDGTIATAEAGYVPNIVMWGGLPFPTVYDYMSGFAQGIEDLNAANSGSVGFDVVLWSGGTEAGQTTSDTEYVYGTSLSSEQNTWYTGGFDADATTTDGASAKIRTENAINANASVVFPIAGGNTGVAEQSLISAGNTTTRLVGVDSDATIASSEDDLYIATAEKNLVDGGALGIWGMDDFDNDGTRNWQDDVAENDTYGQKIIDSSNSWMDWYDEAGSTAGLQLRGTLDNGGAGVVYGSETSAGVTTDFQAMLDFLGKTEEELTTYLDGIAADSSLTIENANAEFVPDGW